jgi:AraC family transcriptional regulator
MPAPSERGGSGELPSGAGQEWLGNSVWRGPRLEISGIKSWPTMTVVSYYRNAGETIMRGDRHRIFFTRDPLSSYGVQVEQGSTRERGVTSGEFSFHPAGLETRTFSPATRIFQIGWDKELYTALLPELTAAASGFEYLELKDPLLGQIVTSLAEECEGGFAGRILAESLGTILCIGIAQRFVGHLPLPTSHGLSPERLQRVRDYVEAHLDEDLSLTMLADIACLSPYHFSRSFKEAVGVGPQRYVIQRRIERAKTLLRRTREPLALIALEAGFGDQSHFTTIFGREMGITPRRFRAELA